MNDYEFQVFDYVVLIHQDPTSWAPEGVTWWAEIMNMNIDSDIIYYTDSYEDMFTVKRMVLQVILIWYEQAIKPKVQSSDKLL